MISVASTLDIMNSWAMEFNKKNVALKDGVVDVGHLVHLVGQIVNARNAGETLRSYHLASKARDYERLASGSSSATDFMCESLGMKLPEHRPN